MELRGKSVSFSSFKIKQRNNNDKKLMTQIADLEQNLTQENINELDNLKAELYEIRKEKVKGAVIRSRAINFRNDENQHSISAHLSPITIQLILSLKYKKMTEQNQI